MYAKWVQSWRDLPLLYSGEGEIVLETDGTDWYIWQLPNWAKK